MLYDMLCILLNGRHSSEPSQAQSTEEEQSSYRWACTLYRPRKPSLATVLVRTSTMPVYFTGLPQYPCTCTIYISNSQMQPARPLLQSLQCTPALASAGKALDCA